MTKKDFITKYLPLAQKAGEAFRINPVVILAQAAIETGWGQSDLCLQHHNFFGITAYGKKNVWWTGTSVQLSTNSLSFRTFHGLCPPAPPRLHRCGRRQLPTSCLCPQNRLQQIHQRSKRRQPRSLPANASLDQSDNRKVNRFLPLIFNL